MPATDLLGRFGLQRNPFTDRTAEKTVLDETSLYIPSDLRGFEPSETTYVFFGRRGSGKTTIRLTMMKAYEEYNTRAVACGDSKGHFMVDICKPGHMTACLRNFKEAISSKDDNWDSQFVDNWTSADMVDCILSFSINQLVHKIITPGEDGRDIVERLRSDERSATQFLLLAHMYAQIDATSLAYLRSVLHPRRGLSTQAYGTVAAGATAVAGLFAGSQHKATVAAVSNACDAVSDELARFLPKVLARNGPAAIALAGAGLLGCGVWMWAKYLQRWSLQRAVQLSSRVRVVQQQPSQVLAQLLNSLLSWQDNVDTIRGLFIGESAHQKLELLRRLVTLLGYESVAVFGDCFDEVVLLDPVLYPGSIKKFAQEVCRNDLLNFGRLHFFFPDSRLALDLNTDKTLKEARFDRHFVRDLTWSRHQLEELAERRFRSAGLDLDATMANGASSPPFHSFSDLFKEVTKEDFSSIINKLSTPRELLIMMTEVFHRLEASADGQLKAQDMEIAVTKAQEQAV